MIKEALQYLVQLGNAKLEEIGGNYYSTQPFHLVQEPVANPITVTSLDGFVDYLKSEFDVLFDVPLMVHVASPTKVVAFNQLNSQKKRDVFIEANALPLLPDFDFDRFYDAETFNIKLQSAFDQNEDRDLVLKVVGNIKDETVKTVGDDGVSQAVVAKTGVATVENVLVPNPVTLKPYRTFPEIEQPESKFVFRMQSGPRCALFEADGGAWKLEAMRKIRRYLIEDLQTEMDDKKLVIIA